MVLLNVKIILIPSVGLAVTSAQSNNCSNHSNISSNSTVKKKNEELNSLSASQSKTDHNRKANLCGQYEQLIHPRAELWFGHLLPVQPASGTTAARRSDSSVYMYGAIQGTIIPPHKEAVWCYTNSLSLGGSRCLPMLKCVSAPAKATVNTTLPDALNTQV